MVSREAKGYYLVKFYNPFTGHHYKRTEPSQVVSIKDMTDWIFYASLQELNQFLSKGEDRRKWDPITKTWSDPNY